MKKKFLRGMIPLLLVAVMCVIQLLPAGAIMIMEKSDEEIASEGTNMVLLNYVFLPEFFGVSGENTKSYAFNGTMTAENADRIIWYSFMGGALTELDTYLTEEGAIIISKADMEAMITETFKIAKPDIRLSKLYDSQKNAIVITEENMSELSLDQPYYGVLGETQVEEYTVANNKCSVRYHFINLDRSHSFRVAIEFEFQIDTIDEMDDSEILYDMNIKLCSFQILGENEMLSLVNGSKLHMEQNWYLCGSREKMAVSDFQAQFKQKNIYCTDDMGNLKTAGFVGTGDFIQLISDTGVITDSVCVIVKGDINGDGKITSTDYLLLKRCFSEDFPIMEPCFKAADVDNNGNLNSTDYLRIKKYMNGTSDLYTN